jgi:hypothetical protein
VDHPHEPAQRPKTTLWRAWLLVVMGFLIVLCCGGCSASFLYALIFDRIPLIEVANPQPVSDTITSSIIVLVIGGVPVLGGLVMIVAGWRRLAARRPP